ncbi:DUF5753 domain-containing protein [Nocardia sp. NBC_00416]|uniref:DUF5753 domain-containing protein n=1 Tax=Nocardia sp. NBC_00416 TaxID=2975991 RepID=UPI002E210084
MTIDPTPDGAGPRWQQWRHLTAAGIAPIQRGLIEAEGRARTIRNYQDQIVPGLLQTEPYARAILNTCIEFTGSLDDIDDAVAARMARQQVLRSEDHRFGVLLAEQVLYTGVGSAEVMRGQLEYLLDVMDLPRQELGIVPQDAGFVYTTTGFVIMDERTVEVETISANLTVTRPSELECYEKVWRRLSERAVLGDEARALIDRALVRLRPM